MMVSSRWCWGWHSMVDYLAIVAWALWMGGFSFYFGVVIRVGSQVVGDSSQGFVTQGATQWLNVIAVVALALLLASAWMARTWLTLGSWTIMAICQAILFALHARLDTFLDSSSQTIKEREPFESTHEWYEFTSAIQWLFAMIFLACWLLPRLRVCRPSDGSSEGSKSGGTA